MIEQHDQLDDALAGRGTALTPEIHALVDLAAEVARSLADWRLSATQRARIRSRVFDLVEPRGLPAWRRLALRQRAPTLIGGAAAITVAAAVGIGVAVARGRRHEHALAA